jgi:hypothetical protein
MASFKNRALKDKKAMRISGRIKGTSFTYVPFSWEYVAAIGRSGEFTWGSGGNKRW